MMNSVFDIIVKAKQSKAQIRCDLKTRQSHGVNYIVFRTKDPAVIHALNTFSGEVSQPRFEPPNNSFRIENAPHQSVFTNHHQLSEDLYRLLSCVAMSVEHVFGRSRLRRLQYTEVSCTTEVTYITGVSCIT